MKKIFCDKCGKDLLTEKKFYRYEAEEISIDAGSYDPKKEKVDGTWELELCVSCRTEFMKFFKR